jgi:Tfp pilus assembly protein PilV
MVLLRSGDMRDAIGADGFSLIETLIACALLTTALLSVGHLSTAAVNMLMDARSRSEATMLAVSKLEELRSSPAPLAGGDTVDARGQPPQGTVSRLFERRWTVAAVSPDAGILTVSVTPSPRGIAGREVRITGGWMATP